MLKPSLAAAVLLAPAMAVATCAQARNRGRAPEADAMEAQLRAQAETIRALEARVASLEAVRPPAPPSAVLVGVSPAQAEAAAPPADSASAAETTVVWSGGGPEFHVGSSTFHLRGRFWLDASATTGSRLDERNIAGTEVRSLRLGADGRWSNHLGYKAEVDLADGLVSVKDLYFLYQARPGGKNVEVYLGNKIGDRTIEGSSGDEFVPFMERSMLATAIGPEKGIFGVGVLAKVIGRDWHIGLNVAGDDANGNPGTASDTLTVSARATFSPALGSTTMLHLGGWGYHEALSRGATVLSKSVYPGLHFNDELRVTSIPIEGAGRPQVKASSSGLSTVRSGPSVNLASAASMQPLVAGAKSAGSRRLACSSPASARASPRRPALGAG